MRDVCAAEGLEARTSPLELPSLRARALIHVARMRAVIIGGTSPTGKRSANQTDLIHLGEAAPYADVFVAEDRGLRAFAKEVRELGCEVLSFSEWADRLTR